MVVPQQAGVASGEGAANYYEANYYESPPRSYVHSNEIGDETANEVYYDGNIQYADRQDINLGFGIGVSCLQSRTGCPSQT